MKKARCFLFLALFAFLFGFSSSFQGVEQPNTGIARESMRAAEEQDTSYARTFTIGMEANYNPFNWTETSYSEGNNYEIQGLSGQFAAGYDVQIAMYICEQNNWDLRIEKMSWDALIPALSTGTIDAVLAGMSDTPERRQSIDFTDPYYESQLVLIARKDDQDFQDDFDVVNNIAGKRLVTQLATVEDTIAMDWADQYGASYANGTTDYPSSFLQVQQNLADAVICEWPVAQSMMDAYPALKMVTFDNSILDESIRDQLSVSIGIQKGDPQGILDPINATLATLDADRRNEIMGAAIERSATLGDSEESSEELSFWDKIGILIADDWQLFGYGIATTLILAVVGTLVGLLIGILVSQVRNWKNTPKDPAWLKAVKTFCRALASIYVNFFRGTPMMIQGMIFFLLGPAIGITWTNMNPGGDVGRIFNGYLLCGLIIICINTGAYMTEIVKSGMNGVDKGQTEAARSLGISKTRSLWGITLPQAIKNCLPTIVNEYIVNIKDSSVLNVIGLTELYATITIATNVNYFRIEGYVIVCFIYLVLVLLTSGLVRLIENKLSIPEKCNLFGFRKDTFKRIQSGFKNLFRHQEEEATSAPIATPVSNFTNASDDKPLVDTGLLLTQSEEERIEKAKANDETLSVSPSMMKDDREHKEDNRHE